MLKRFINYSAWIILFAAAIMMFSGCGGKTFDAPLGSEITFNKGDMDVVNNETTPVWFDEDITIIVKNENGLPLRDVELTITYPWAVPSGTVVQFYDGGAAVNSPMKATTDENGTYTLKFKYLLDDLLEYTGSISVVSGSAFGSVKFTVAISSG